MLYEVITREGDAFDQLFQMRITAGLIFSLQLVEGTIVSPAFHFLALELAQHLIFTLEHVRGTLGKIKDLISLLYPEIVQFRADGGGHIAGQCPGGGRPHQQGFTLTLSQREAQFV